MNTAKRLQTRENTLEILNTHSPWPDSTPGSMVSAPSMSRMKPASGGDPPGDARHRGPNNPEITEYFRHWCDTEVAGGRSKNGVARDLGVSNSHIVNILNGKNGVGGDLLRKFAQRVSGGSVDKLQQMAEEYVRRYGFTAPKHERHKFSERPGWAEALERAQELAPHIPASVWQDVGEMSAAKLQLDASVLIHLATLYVAQQVRGRV